MSESGRSFEGMYERARLASSVDAHLERMAQERGHELELATPEQSAEWILLQRLMFLLVEESQEWDPQQRANLRSVVVAYGAISFPRFTQREQHTFTDRFMDLFTQERWINLDRDQATMLSHISQRVGIPFDPEPTTFTFTTTNRLQNKRITEVEDPAVTALIDNASESDKVGHILANISSLTLRLKVKLLLTLSDEEFEQFKERRRAGFADIAFDIFSNPDLVADQAERIRAVSQLRYTTPRYEVEADIRRQWRGKYPSEWDEDLEEDPRFKPNDGLIRVREGRSLSWEEAVEFTRFENVRRFYRNILFPSVARRDNPLPITIDTLYDTFQAHRRQISAMGKPGTNITAKDLLASIEFYLGYEPDNRESCEIHRKVQVVAALINAAEEALEN